MSLFNQNSFMNYLNKVMSIDSVSGFHEDIQQYIINVLSEMEIPYDVFYKGGIVAHINGDSPKTAIMAHIDTIGMMVKGINQNGTLNVCPIGGLSPVYEVGQDVTIHTMDNRKITGTVQKINSSVHMMNSQEKRTVEPGDFVVFLDYNISNSDQVKKLGIKVGDMIAPNPNLSYKNGYIKSRFLDDKAAVAILLTLINDFSINKNLCKKGIDFYFTAFEETGHGASLLNDEKIDTIALEIACMGKSQNSNEHEVSIYPNFGGYVSNRNLLKKLVKCAEKNNISYNLDIIISGGNDNNSAIIAGHDIRHCAIGFGTLASHGYERTHIDAIKATYDLLFNYIIGK